MHDAEFDFSYPILRHQSDIVESSKGGPGPPNITWTAARLLPDAPPKGISPVRASPFIHPSAYAYAYADAYVLTAVHTVHSLAFSKSFSSQIPRSIVLAAV